MKMTRYTEMCIHLKSELKILSKKRKGNGKTRFLNTASEMIGPTHHSVKLNTLRV